MRLQENDEEVNDGRSDAGSSHSNYSTTNAKIEKKIAWDNKVARGLPWAPVIPSVEEEDIELLEQYFTDTGGRRNRNHKSKKKDDDDDDPQHPHSNEDEGYPDDDVGDERSPDDDVDGPVTPWDITPGPLSKAHLEEAMAARTEYHATLEDIARRSGKKLSSVFNAVGDYPKGTRDANTWNAHQMKYRTEHPKPSKSAWFSLFVLSSYLPVYSDPGGIQGLQRG
jgi:hypothetical protein